MDVKHHSVTLFWMFSVYLGIGPAYAQQVVINEFMASNSGAVSSQSGEEWDWIELHNPSNQTVSLAGLYLSDKVDNVTKWQFPADRPDLTTLLPGGYLIIWASASNSTTTELHADFSLDADGEAVVLTAADAVSEIDRIQFGTQYADISYGRQPGDHTTWGYMVSPTPGQANSQAYPGIVQPVRFSVERGFYDEPFSLVLSTSTPGVEIWYTLNADVPHERDESSGQLKGQRYTSPIQISTTTCVRAVAIKSGWKDSSIVSHTYLYVDDVIRQPRRPDGFPSRWGSRSADYEMDGDVVNNAAYSATIKDDLKSTPSVCLVIPNADFFEGDGIYANPTRYGDLWERATSMEWIDPNTGEHFGVNAGLRIHGGPYSRSQNPKNALRVIFRREYGPAKLEYSLFPDTDVQAFNVLALRSIWNYSWTGHSGMGGARHADYLRDVFARDTVRDMQHLTPHGRPIQLYINGLYWGLYIMTERPDETFAADYIGGDKEDYQVLEAPSGYGASTDMQVKSGGAQAIQAWNDLFMLSEMDLTSYNAYLTIRDYIDVPAMVDYMLMIYYVGSRDAPVFLGDSYTPRNFYAARRNESGCPFVIIPWDVEWSLEQPTVNRVPVVGVWNPHTLMDRLAENEEFRLLLADHIYRHFFNDGVLTKDKATQRYLDRASEIYGAIVGESARWGDAASRWTTYTREDWEAEVDRLVNEYFAVRTDIVLRQLENHGWYPTVDPPIFQVGEQDQRGGHVPTGTLLTLANPSSAGTVYYTLEGTDPRRRPQRQSGMVLTLVSGQALKRVLVPTEDIGYQWQGASEPYDDAFWIHGRPTDDEGQGAVGFYPPNTGQRSGYGPLITYDVADEMSGRNGSCYIRIPFYAQPEDLQLQSLYLRVRCDDGFVAYLNGTEVTSHGRPDSLRWDSVSAVERSKIAEHLVLDISEHVDQLKVGKNILAVHALNYRATEDDPYFVFSGQLLGVQDYAEDTEPTLAATAQVYERPILLTQSQHIKTRVFDGQWSALNEATYAVGSVAENLRITEVMYHPQDPNAEFIELTNIGAEAINIHHVAFTRGIRFTCPSMDLPPQTSVVVVRDTTTFGGLYGPDVSMAGQYEGNLDNGGERLVLEDAAGAVIHDFRYNDAWYPTTDGGGRSLEIVDFLADPSTWSDASAWSQSAIMGGTPGK
jgi:hypothetical protein